MSNPLRTILLIGNSGFFILSFLAFASLFSDSRTQPTFYLVFIPLIILFILSVYFLAGPSSLYFKRKKLEEEIKIQEAENKLNELKLTSLSSSKEKN